MLIVDDSEDSREMYRLFLEHLGYRVDVAPDGAIGLSTAFTARPDAIVMDLTMPGVSGWSACRQLKADPRTSATPIIVLSAHAMKDAEAGARAAGCDDYLAKPCLPETLAAAIARQLGRRPHV